MAEPSYRTLRKLNGLIEYQRCNKEEYQRFAEMLKNGEQLPDGVFKSSEDDLFYHIIELVPPEKEQMYVLMRISKDLHFISTLMKVMLVLGIIATIVALIIT